MDIIPLFAAKPRVCGSNLIAETTPMPMYDYQCASCGHQLEAIQKISAAALVDCPACQAPELKKMLSMPGFRLSGTGWYETDFKTGSKKKSWPAATKLTRFQVRVERHVRAPASSSS